MNNKYQHLMQFILYKYLIPSSLIYKDKTILLFYLYSLIYFIYISYPIYCSILLFRSRKYFFKHTLKNYQHF
jgi:hypothetical protein